MRFRFLVPGLVLAFGTAGGCGGGDDNKSNASGPPTGCAALEACCNAITDPTMQASCNSTLSSDESLPDPDQTCTGSIGDYQSYCAAAGADGGGGGTIAPAGGFAATSSSWALPTTYPAQTFVSPTGGVAYFLADFNKDKKLDLIVTPSGQNDWLVYASTGSGFATTSKSWTVPSGASPSAGTGVVEDFNGDGVPDLLQVTETNYNAFPGGASGFATTATVISIPAAVGSSEGDFRGALYDLDGDGILDFVQTTDGTTTSGLGTTHWNLYKGTTTFTFAASAVSWPLPSGFVQGAFGNFQKGLNGGGNSCAGETLAVYTVTDMDADGHPDLVVFDDCKGGAVGKAQWDVYLGSASGFAATTTAWMLPQASLSTLFGGSGYDFGGGFSEKDNLNGLQYAVLDFNGDKKPDLLAFGVTGPTGGSYPWDLYLSTGTSFSATPLSWAYPSSFAAVGNGAQFVWNGCFDGHFAQNVVDFTGDGIPDLMETSDCNSGSTVGSTNWLLYAGQPTTAH